MPASLTAPILAFQRESAPGGAQPPVLCGEQEFPLLLAGVPALRRTPGLATQQDLGGDYFTTIPYCRDEQGTALAREHLARIFGITDRDSLISFCRDNVHVHHQYLDFESFWEDRPAFSLDELEPGGRRLFQDCAQFALQFQPIVGRRGFLAWDISETMGHLRAACACGLISLEEYEELSGYWTGQAAAFHSWQEYAVSLVCGGAYWAYRVGDSQEEVSGYVDLNLRLVRQLLGSKRAWAGRLWYRSPGKAYRLSPPELRPLLRGWEGPDGCFATDNITVLGRPVGYCYRDTPQAGYPDSGWRFFSGEESPEYLSDLSHTQVFPLNTVCNYDPGIISLLNAPCGTAYFRGEDGVFHEEPLVPPRD